jgi:hypothetical protein
MPRHGRNDFYATTPIPAHKPHYTGYRTGDLVTKNWGPEKVREYLEKTYGTKLRFEANRKKEKYYVESVRPCQT